jgi:hypothetical protein
VNGQAKEQLDIETVADRLSEKEKAAFFDIFWKAWSANGFGTLTKKDTELLIFGCLRRAFGRTGPKNNYEWAKLLRLTPAKVRSMRLEAYLRYGHLLEERDADTTEQFLKNFGMLQSIDVKGLKSSGDLDNVTVSFVIEDPVTQMVIENRLKEAGTYLDFHRNREVVKLKLTDFFRMLAGDVERKLIDQWVAKTAKEQAKADSLKARVSAREYADKTEMGKLMAFVDDLAKFGKVDVLTNHLKRIFRSQSEHKK